MSNTRYHSIGLKVKEKQESNPGRQSDDWMGENSRGKANLKRWVLSFERNVETDNELRVSGGREFQSLGAMTEKALLPRDVRTYGMDRTDESDDLVDRVRRKRKTIVKIGRLLNLKRFICKKAQFVIDAWFDWKPM